jgi:hypothetical protein
VIRAVESGQSLTEAQIVHWARGIVAGLAHLHGRGVAHLDLKLENVFIDGPSDVDPLLAPELFAPLLGDFGFAVQGLSAISTRFEGPFVPPEASLATPAPYDPFRADMWSLGVCLVAMRTGHTVKVNRAGRVTFGPGIGWDHFSPSMQRVLRGLLSVDPMGRPTATELLSDPWVQSGGDSALPVTSSSSGAAASDCDDGNDDDGVDYPEGGGGIPPSLSSSSNGQSSDPPSTPAMRASDEDDMVPTATPLLNGRDSAELRQAANLDSPNLVALLARPKILAGDLDLGPTRSADAEAAHPHSQERLTMAVAAWALGHDSGWGSAGASSSAVSSSSSSAVVATTGPLLHAQSSAPAAFGSLADRTAPRPSADTPSSILACLSSTHDTVAAASSSSSSVAMRGAVPDFPPDAGFSLGASAMPQRAPTWRPPTAQPLRHTGLLPSSTPAWNPLQPPMSPAWAPPGESKPPPSSPHSITAAAVTFANRHEARKPSPLGGWSQQLSTPPSSSAIDQNQIVSSSSSSSSGEKSVPEDSKRPVAVHS